MAEAVAHSKELRILDLGFNSISPKGADSIRTILSHLDDESLIISSEDGDCSSICPSGELPMAYFERAYDGDEEHTCESKQHEIFSGDSPIVCSKIFYDSITTTDCCGERGICPLDCPNEYVFDEGKLLQVAGIGEVQCGTARELAREGHMKFPCEEAKWYLVRSSECCRKASPSKGAL